ncbi:MAG: hypothetical protein ABIH38_04760 [Patescibacteria group bacterium]
MQKYHVGKHILQVGVIGSAGTEEYHKGYQHPRGYLEVGFMLGQLLGKEGATVITGGEGGLMAAVEKGVKKYHGITVGIFKSLYDISYDVYSDIDVVTEMGEGGPEYILPMCCNVIISIGGGAGTLNEICVAYRNKVPVILLRGFDGWTDKLADSLYKNHYLDVRERTKFEVVNNPEDAAKMAIKIGKKHLRDLLYKSRLIVQKRKFIHFGKKRRIKE